MKVLGLSALVLLAVISLVYLSLAYIDFDEGFNLQVPSRLASNGAYATTYDGGMLFDPAVTTGPTVLVPIAAIFKVFGEGYVQARIVCLTFFILLALTTFHLTRRVYGLTAAVIACGLVFTAPDIFRFGLRALGEVPGLVFLFAGLLAMTYRRGFLAGSLIGCAIVTKFILILTVIPVGLLWIGSALFARRRWRQYSGVILGIASIIVLWEVIQLAGAGLPAYVELKWRFVNMLRDGGGAASAMAGTGLLARAETLKNAFGGIGAWNGIVILAAALYGMLAVRDLKNKERDADVRFILAIIAIFFTLWWFFTNNMGWWRHYLPGYLALAPILAVMIARLLHAAAENPGIKSSGSGFLAIAILLTMISMPAFRNLHEAITGANGLRLDEQKKFAAKISKIQADGGQVAGWGWHQTPEISFLTGKVFLNAQEPQARQLLERAADTGKGAYLVISPVQQIADPDSWPEERRWADDLVTLNGGYRLYGYLSDKRFERQLDLLLQREQWEGFSSVYTPGNPQIQRAQYQEGLLSDGWMTGRAAIWLRSESKQPTLIFDVENPKDGLGRPAELKFLAQNRGLGEVKLFPGERKSIPFRLTASDNTNSLIKAGIKADSVFVPSKRKPSGEGLGVKIKQMLGVSSFDHRELSIKVHLIEVK